MFCLKVYLSNFPDGRGVLKIKLKYMLNKPLLYDLFKAYYDARKNKRNTMNQLDFEINLESNIINLYEELVA
jgi:hypothetical protein